MTKEKGKYEKEVRRTWSSNKVMVEGKSKTI
jgi:hypothetical protein